MDRANCGSMSVSTCPLCLPPTRRRISKPRLFGFDPGLGGGRGGQRGGVVGVAVVVGGGVEEQEEEGGLLKANAVKGKDSEHDCATLV